MESFRPAGRGNVTPDAGRTGGRSGETRVFVCEGLGGPRRGTRAAPSARGSGVHGEAPGCASTGVSGVHGEVLGLRRPRGLGGARGGPGNVSSVRAASGLLSALLHAPGATRGAGKSCPVQEPRQGRRQQPMAVLRTEASCMQNSDFLWNGLITNKGEGVQFGSRVDILFVLF